jgi:hypothetical protein
LHDRIHSSELLPLPLEFFAQFADRFVVSRFRGVDSAVVSLQTPGLTRPLLIYRDDELAAELRNRLCSLQSRVPGKASARSGSIGSSQISHARIAAIMCPHLR